MDYPAPQIYVVLAISVALLGLAVSRSKTLEGNTGQIVLSSIFVLCSWLHLVVSFSSSIKSLEPIDVIFHLFNLAFFFASLVCIGWTFRRSVEKENLGNS